MCFAFFAQSLVKHENNVFSRRKVDFFAQNLLKDLKKRIIFSLKLNSGYYNHITPYFKDMCKNTYYTWFSTILAEKL